MKIIEKLPGLLIIVLGLLIVGGVLTAIVIEFISDISDYGISYTLGKFVGVSLFGVAAFFPINAITDGNAGVWLSKHFSSFTCFIMGAILLMLVFMGVTSIPKFISMTGLDVSSSFWCGFSLGPHDVKTDWTCEPLFLIFLYLEFVLYNIIKVKPNAIFHLRVFISFFALIMLLLSVLFLMANIIDTALDVEDMLFLLGYLFLFAVSLKIFLITYSRDTAYFFPIEKRKVGVFDIFLSTLLYSGTIYSIILRLKL